MLHPVLDQTLSRAPSNEALLQKASLINLAVTGACSARALSTAEGSRNEASEPRPSAMVSSISWSVELRENTSERKRTAFCTRVWEEGTGLRVQDRRNLTGLHPGTDVQYSHGHCSTSSSCLYLKGRKRPRSLGLGLLPVTVCIISHHLQFSCHVPQFVNIKTASCPASRE